MRDPATWLLRLLWLALPFTAGLAYGEALDGIDGNTALSVGLWVLWAAGVGALLVPRTVTLTAIRVAAPATLPLSIWASACDGVSGLDVLALAVTAAVAVVALSPQVGDVFVNGSAYGPERRMPLRAPGALLLGPIELVWVLVVAGGVVGPVLIATGGKVLGIVLLVLGWPVAVLGTRSLHSLARRWVVFVPAGMVLHDPLLLVDALLFPRNTVRSLGPAPADSTALDLTRGAPGLALEVRLTERRELSFGRVRGRAEGVESEAILFTPSRPGALLREARDRGLPVS